MNRLCPTLLISVFLLPFAPINALANADLFSKLEGSFRGSGMSVTDVSGKKRRVSCQLSNKYDKGAKKLKMKGKCASSQGAAIVKGTISHNNGKISGSYIGLRSRAQMIKSSGKSGRKSVVIYSSFRDRKDDKIYKIKQVLQLNGAGFQANFFTFDNSGKKYKSAGVISFKRK